ncbi:MAG: hypothetical protein HY075_16165 [Deltaproteobacteria bacterium]|nr:hypothetical protein [Deltaproteobacteria bacterium]
MTELYFPVETVVTLDAAGEGLSCAISRDENVLRCESNRAGRMRVQVAVDRPPAKGPARRGD